jgi:cytochrome P450
VTVREGQGVFCHLGAANGDPTQQADAELVDLARRDLAPGWLLSDRAAVST